MQANSRRQSVLFPDLFEKPVVAAFDEDHMSTDAGALLLHATDRRLGLIDGLTACISDRRNRAQIEYAVADFLRQRILGLACGYADCNDAERTRNDPILKMCSGRSPVGDDTLASQPTLSRFENSVTFDECARMQSRLAMTVIKACKRRYGKHAKKIVIDLDPTDDPTYGAQQLAIFNGHYDNWCYMPMLGFLSFDDHCEQHAFWALLRPGNAHASLGTLDLLTDVIPVLRETFPKATIVVRLDGGFGSPELFAWLDAAPRVKYVVGFAKNSILEEGSEPLMAIARSFSALRGTTVSIFDSVSYGAKSWKGVQRRVVVKAEVVRLDDKDPLDNARFVVTNLTGRAEDIYAFYCKRGDSENRIKELKIDLFSGRTSCSNFVANQLRLTMSLAAFVLMQELRSDAEGTDLAGARVDTMRWKLLKVAVRVVESVRRIVLHLPASYPWSDTFRRLAGLVARTN